jgi:hypothetical protein
MCRRGLVFGTLAFGCRARHPPAHPRLLVPPLLPPLALPTRRNFQAAGDAGGGEGSHLRCSFKAMGHLGGWSPGGCTRAEGLRVCRRAATLLALTQPLCVHGRVRGLWAVSQAPLEEWVARTPPPVSPLFNTSAWASMDSAVKAEVFHACLIGQARSFGAWALRYRSPRLADVAAAVRAPSRMALHALSPRASVGMQQPHTHPTPVLLTPPPLANSAATRTPYPHLPPRASSCLAAAAAHKRPPLPSLRFRSPTPPQHAHPTPTPHLAHCRSTRSCVPGAPTCLWPCFGAASGTCPSSWATSSATCGSTGAW